MSNLLKTMTAATVLTIGLGFAPIVHAEQGSTPESNDSQMGTGMGHGGMMGMHRQQGSDNQNDGSNGMMGRGNDMMSGCASMMQSQRQPPNSQFPRSPAPSPQG